MTASRPRRRDRALNGELVASRTQKPCLLGRFGCEAHSTGRVPALLPNLALVSAKEGMCIVWHRTSPFAA